MCWLVSEPSLGLTSQGTLCLICYQGTCTSYRHNLDLGIQRVQVIFQLLLWWYFTNFKESQRTSRCLSHKCPALLQKKKKNKPRNLHYSSDVYCSPDALCRDHFCFSPQKWPFTCFFLIQHQAPPGIQLIFPEETLFYCSLACVPCP